MERVLRNTPATISGIFQVGGVDTDPSPATATVEVVRENGTVLVAAGTPTTRVSAGKFSTTLTAAQTALVDILTARWTSSLGTIETTVEVVGGFLFTVADFRAMEARFADATAYPATKIQEARTLAEQALENACNVAFVPRYHRERLDGSGGYVLLTRWPKVRAIRDVKIDGTAISAPDLALAVGRPVGIYSPTAWTYAYGNVEVTYEHGWKQSDPGRPPAGRPAMMIARDIIAPSQFDARTTRFETDGGIMDFARANGDFGIPEVDAFVGRHSYGALIA